MRLRLLIASVAGMSALCAAAFDPPAGFDFVDPTDLDQWVEDGLIQEDERAQLLEWIDDPLDLNRAEMDELRLLPFVDEPLAEEIDAARRERPFESLNDLERVRGLQGGLNMILPFVTVHSYRSSGRIRQRLSDRRNDGDPALIYGYLRLNPTPNAVVGLAQRTGGAERAAWDADASIVRPLESARLSRGYFAWSGEGAVQRLIVGDYSVGSGLGLILNSARLRYPTGARPNDSSLPRERGAAVETRIGRFNALAFASRNSLSDSLPSKLTGLAEDETVENALYSDLIGARVESGMEGWRFGATAAAQRRQPKAGQGIDEATRTGAALDFDGRIRQTRWRGEAAYANAPAGWTELLTRSRTASARIAFYALPAEFESPRGSARSDRRGILARAAFYFKNRRRVGFQMNGEKQISTAISSQSASGWIASPIGRIITAGIVVRWYDRDLLIDNETEWRTTEWAAAAFQNWRISMQWTQENGQTPALLTRVDWRAVKGLICGARVQTEGSRFALRELSGYASLWSRGSWRCRPVFIRRWSESGTSNRAVLTLDARWGSP